MPQSSFLNNRQLGTRLYSQAHGIVGDVLTPAEVSICAHHGARPNLRGGPTGAQQSPQPGAPAKDTLADGPQVFNSTAQKLRVVTLSKQGLL